LATSRLDFERAARNNPTVAQVVLKHLTKVFGGPNGEARSAVDDLDLVIADGELLALVGPSGCGKTTTLRLIAGLDSPTSGSIFIGGKVVNRTAPKDRGVAMVFQSPALYPHFSVYDNLAFGLKLRGFSGSEIQRRVSAAVARLGLSDCLQRLPMTLSGGQRQRVALGRALVRQPDVLLCDEPLSHLDAPARAQLRSDIREIQRNFGVTVLYVTHDQVEAMAMGQRVAVMQAGIIHQVGSPASIYRCPADLFVAGFFGTPPMNFFRGSLRPHSEGTSFECLPGPGSELRSSLIFPTDRRKHDQLKPHLGREVILGLRPEHIQEVCPGIQTPVGHAVKAKTQSLESLGAETLLHLTAHGYSFIMRLRVGSPILPDAIVPVLFDMEQAHFFDPDSGRNLCAC
jgi:multiple sugar transport system ATP-binding protein